MDFTKAFDKVPHKRLLYKLKCYGIRGSTHKWIASWLSERYQKVVLDGQALDPVPVLSGVPQGSLTFFYKIHSGTVSLDKDRYLTPAPNLKSTRASQTHNSQYARYMAYSDALKNSFFPRTIPLWNSLPSSVVSSKTAEEFKALI